MKFNIDKAKQLLGIFGELNTENQEALLVKAFEMQFEQNMKRNLENEKKVTNEKNTDDYRHRFLDVVKPVMERWEEFGPNGHAALAMLLNDLTNGEFTKEENIDFVISTRQLSITEYIDKNIPGADNEVAREIYINTKKKMQKSMG